MLHILLLILKIIGIALLVIFGVLLLGIACALFVPVRYRIEAVRREGEGEPPVTVRVKVTWLLHLINFLLRFDGTVFVRVRIFLFTILRIPKKEKRRRRSEKGKSGGKERKQEETVQTKSREAGEKDGQSAVTAVETVPENSASQMSRADDTEGRQEPPDEEDRESTEEAQEKPGLWDKLCAIPEILRRLYEKIKSLFENIQYTICRFCDKIRSVSDTIEYYREVVEGEPFKRSFALCKDELLTVVRSLRPRKFEVSLIIGMDDPASTGEILAVCGILYPVIGGHVDIRGDFERKRLEGEVLIVGRLRMVTFLRTAVRIYFNKDIRKLYRLLKRRQ